MAVGYYGDVLESHIAITRALEVEEPQGAQAEFRDIPETAKHRRGGFQPADQCLELSGGAVGAASDAFNL